MIRIGIDPGKNGYICIYAEIDDVGGVFEYYPIPLIGKEVDINTLCQYLYADGAKVDIHFCIEDVHAIFGSSAKATFNFGYIVGVLEALLVAHHISYTKVTPKEWQKEMWQGIPLQKKPNGRTDTKAMSLLAAKRLFPNEDMRDTERCTTSHDGKVDALLICEYCKRKF